MLRLLIIAAVVAAAVHAAHAQVDSPHAEKARQKAQKALEGNQKRINEERDRIAREMGIEKSDERQEGQNVTGKLGPMERIYIFVSSSMPLKALRRYAQDLDSLADPNITMVMRGFVGGMKTFKPTGDFIESVLKKDEGCELVTGNCEVYNAGIEIDPLLFRKYGITRVPAVVYVPEVKSEVELHEGSKNDGEISEYYVVYGDASFEYVMEVIGKVVN